MFTFHTNGDDITSITFHTEKLWSRCSSYLTAMQRVGSSKLIDLFFLFEPQYVGLVHEVVGGLAALQVLEDAFGPRADQQTA